MIELAFGIVVWSATILILGTVALGVIAVVWMTVGMTLWAIASAVINTARWGWYWLRWMTR